MLDIRYHWLTLVALFLSLGLGIVIGTGLGERGTLSREQARLAEQLEASLMRLREENQALRRAGEEMARDLEAVQAIAETIARASVTGRLAGRTVVLVVPDAALGSGAPSAPGDPKDADDTADASGGGRGDRGGDRDGSDGNRRGDGGGRGSGPEAVGSATAPLEEDSVASGTGGAAAWGVVDRWEALLKRAGATVVRQGARQTAVHGGQGGSVSAPAPGAVALYVNPPPNVPIPDGLRAAVVWDGDGPWDGVHGDGVAGTPKRGNRGQGDDRARGSRGGGDMVLPSDWLVVRAGRGTVQDAVAEWALIEGLRGGWSGYVDAAGPAETLYGRLGDLIKASSGDKSR